MLGFFQLAHDVPGYEEMEFRRPEPNGDTGLVEGEEKGRYQDENVNGVGEGVNVSIEEGIIQTNGDGIVERRSGWVEEVKEDQDELEKVD